MYNTDKVKDLITAPEAVKLIQYGSTCTMEKVSEIVKTYQQTTPTKQDEIWEFLKIGCLLFEAGRVQGIREERAKRRSL